jgi:hypothetical protein
MLLLQRQVSPNILENLPSKAYQMLGRKKEKPRGKDKPQLRPINRGESKLQ